MKQRLQSWKAKKNTFSSTSFFGNLFIVIYFGLSSSFVFAQEKKSPSPEAKRSQSLQILKKQIQFAALKKRKSGIKKIIKFKAEEQKIFVLVLEKLLVKDPDPSIRQTAINALGRMKQKSSEDSFIKALEDNNVSVVREAVSALRLIESKKAGAPLSKKLNGMDATTNNQLLVSIVNYLGSIEYKNDADALLVILKDSATHLEVKRAIILYFGNAKVLKMKSELVKLLEDENADLGSRSYAANSLGHLGDSSVVASLKEELKKIEEIPDSRTRAKHNRFKSNVTLAMLRLGDRSVVPYVLAQLRNDDPRKRILATRRVSSMKLEGGREHLEYMSEYDSSAKVKKAAKSALENWGKKNK